MKLEQTSCTARHIPNQRRVVLPGRSFGVQRSLFGVQRSRPESGIALVITLIMLSIITFMAVTFLVLSQRERSSVTGDTDMKIARNASDAALARVSAELLTHMLLHTNFQDFDLLVSTNYINYGGFIDGLPPNPENVNYDHETNKIGFTGGATEWARNIADLLYNPRPPVFVVTNRGTGASEFRFYLDLDRNGRFDPNGNFPVVVNDAGGGLDYLTTNAAGQFVDIATNSLAPGEWILTNNMTGDPEWIGVLERPNELHSADNRFIARYAYIVIPVGKTLDLNYIHNRAKRITLTGEGFLRNQGVGTWEINLAAFLADLNTNVWWNGNNYFYNTDSAFPSLGSAFTNANDLLNYRYGNSYLTLDRANALLSNNALPLTLAGIDLYSDGPLMLSTTNTSGTPADNPTLPWSGSDNSNHFFSEQDLFDAAKVLPPSSFRTTLANLGTSNDTYNAYTYYRMLAQLGTDSSPEQNKLNINFKNTDIRGNIVPGMETNLIPWTPLDFFTNAADRMLAQITNQIGYPLTVENIPLYPTNYYTPAVHRILQLAANIYDATTNQTVPLLGGQTNDFFPSVYRPLFTSQNGQVWISGYTNVIDTTPLSYQYWDFNTASNRPGVYAALNIYGVPWVIGAKSGFPNFNEYALETAMSVSRKLKLTKQVPGGDVVDVRQLFDVGISNTLAVEAWNSYLTAYPRGLSLSVSNEFGIGMTNQFGNNLIPSGWQTYVQFMPLATNIPPNTWNPMIDQSRLNNSMLIPLQGGFEFLTNATFVPTLQRFVANNPALFISAASNAMPEMFLTTTNRVQYSLVDTTVVPNRVVDFVNLESISTVDISDAIRRQTQCGTDPRTDIYAYWCTNLLQNTGFVPNLSLNQGVNVQLGVAAGLPPLTLQQWQQVDPDDPDNQAQIINFNKFIFKNGDTNLVMQTPFSPTAYIYEHTSWQANDPLVHYTIGDLTDPAKSSLDGAIGNPPLDNIGRLNTRYRPWGGNSLNPDPKTDVNVALKDPGMTQSAAWDFPTNKFPSLGWLGRVHRGSPWQTVYMKSPLVATNDWQLWGGDASFITNGAFAFQDASLSVPVMDYQLFDVFTTAVNDNASRGQLDVNQTNLAAWSAVLGGVIALTNAPVGQFPMVISPAGVYDPSNPAPAMAQIWKGINDTRSSTNRIFPNASFQHVGDVLATPQLSIASPFLNVNPVPGVAGTGLASVGANGINDEIMERIPQQIMSLLTLNQTPRFVIYSFGQTLHPADHSLVIGGTFNGLCTNYQVTAETATRAVVRVEGTPDPQFTGGKVDSQGRSYPPHIVVEQFNVLGPD